MDNDIITIQEIISHQGDEIIRMSRELYIQQLEISRLREQMDKINIRLNSSSDGGDGIRPVDQESPPPHY